MTDQDDDRRHESGALARRLHRLPVIGPLLGNPVLRNREFHKLCGSSAFNNIGFTGELVIVGILIFETTQSSAWVGVAVALYSLPMLVFGLLSGVLADWMDRRILLKRVELAIILNLLIFSVVFAVAPAELWLILVFTVISGTIRDSAFAARISFAYDLIGERHVVAGLSLLSLASRSGQLIGALMTGAIMQQYGAPAAIAGLAAAHVVAFALLSWLRPAGSAQVTESTESTETTDPTDPTDSTESTEPVSMGENLRQCLVELCTNKVLLMLVVITGVVEVFGFSFSTTLPELATNRFRVGAEGLGEMHAARAVGGILAAIALASFVGSKTRGTIFLYAICAFGVGLWLLAAASQLALALASIVIIAGLATASDVLTQSMMQLSVPDHLRGRAMGIWVFAIGWAPVGHLQIGMLAETIGVSIALQFNGAILVCVGIVAALAVPRLRKL